MTDDNFFLPGSLTQTFDVCTKAGSILFKVSDMNDKTYFLTVAHCYYSRVNISNISP